MAPSPTWFANTMGATMAQFDVYVNPISAARRAYPFVVAMQSDFARDTRDQIVAPLVRREAMPKVVSRLTPIVVVEGSEYLAIVPALAGVRSRDLAELRASLASARSELLAAIDHLFFGV